MYWLSKCLYLLCTLGEKLNSILDLREASTVQEILHSDSLGDVELALVNVVCKFSEVQLLKGALDVELVGLETALREALREVGLTTLEASVHEAALSGMSSLHTTTSLLAEAGARTSSNDLVGGSCASVIPEVLGCEGKELLLLLLILR
jgi:hypothetical protein